MNLQGRELRKAIETGLKRYDSRLPMTIHAKLYDLSHQLNSDAEVDLFEILVRLTTEIQQEPAEIIANLMTATSADDLASMDEHVVSNIGYYLRDVMKAQGVICALRRTQ